ncbi:SAM-dependent methyltransferase [Corallincola platygyrae]|uniref:SAM-dependent methyltransferase n=1 Tax=Corallincola platygyrae TaxID=1193278 RepID=A0ABW4XIZ3_9GAMM
MHSIKSGRLSVVGTGMMLGAHITPIAKSYIEEADIVFASVSHSASEAWLSSLNPNFYSLQQFYGEGRSREQTYALMVETVLSAVNDGKSVCAAFYGHPGVFAWAPHELVREARRLSIEVAFEPGISAEDCLYTDLGIDPGDVGCQHFAASQFMYHQRRVDPSAYLVIWQPAMAGDLSMTRFEPDARYLRLLVELLLETYPAGHKVVLYEAATLPFADMRSDEVLLEKLAEQPMAMHTTLVIPPSQPLKRNLEMIERIKSLSEKA